MQGSRHCEKEKGVSASKSEPHQSAAAVEMVLSALGRWLPVRHLTQPLPRARSQQPVTPLFVTDVRQGFKGQKQCSTKANTRARGGVLWWGIVCYEAAPVPCLKNPMMPGCFLTDPFFMPPPLRFSDCCFCCFCCFCCSSGPDTLWPWHQTPFFFSLFF